MGGTKGQESGTPNQEKGDAPPEGEKPNGQANAGASGTPSAAANNTGTKEGEADAVDIAKLDPKVQKIISDLRKENGDWRTKNKSLSENHTKLKKSLIEAGIIENDEEAPEEKLKSIQTQHEQSVFQNIILESAIEHGVAKDDLKYFSFLVNEKVNELEDDAELTAEDIALIAKQAKRTVATPANTSVDGKPPANAGAPSDVTLDRFVKMNMGEKTELYLKNKDAYTRLMAEAKEKRMLM